MKKLIALSCFLLIFISCTDNDDENSFSNSIIGVWARTEPMEDPSMNQTLQYTFYGDHTVEIVRMAVDASTSEILGFRYKGIGTYEIDGDTLHVSLSEIYKHDDSSELYSSEAELELSDDTSDESLAISFSESGDILIFDYPPCPMNANCIDTLSLERVGG